MGPLTSKILWLANRGSLHLVMLVLAGLSKFDQHIVLVRKQQDLQGSQEK